MKKILSFGAIVLLTTLPACRSNKNNDVVKVTYVHKYGVPVSESDWSKHGQDGQIVELTNQGVTISKSYQKGTLHGDTTYSFPNSSTVQYKERYEKGLLVSKCENYPSGVPACEEIFEDNNQTKVISWYEQGTPSAIERYDDGLLVTGEYRSLSNEIESRVLDGHGIRYIRNNEGELAAKESIQNGKRIERITFYTNGEPESVIPYQNGLVHGTKLTFLSGAIPYSVEQWVHGFQEGTTILYQNGEKVAEIPYVRGKREGVARYYRDATLLVEEATWKNDCMHGPRTLHLGEGQTRVEWYLEGDLVSKPTFDRLDPIR